jgi:hypothetical protein
MKYHYVYYSYEEWGRGYIGSRTSLCPPKEDVKYMGSYTDKSFKPTKKIILETFFTREEAFKAEVILHEFYNIDCNSHFANRAKQTFTGFKISFEKTIEEIRKKQIGRKASPKTREKMSQSHKGRKASPEAVAKMKQRVGILNPNFGKKWWNNGKEQRLQKQCPGAEWKRGCLPLPEERKQKMRSLHLGKKWWTDGVLVKHCVEPPANNWYRKYPEKLDLHLK